MPALVEPTILSYTKHGVRCWIQQAILVACHDAAGYIMHHDDAASHSLVWPLVEWEVDVQFCLS